MRRIRKKGFYYTELDQNKEPIAVGYATEDDYYDLAVSLKDGAYGDSNIDKGGTFWYSSALGDSFRYASKVEIDFYEEKALRRVSLDRDLDEELRKVGLAPLTLSEYQVKAMTTCMESCNRIEYMVFNLFGEIGEFASKIAKGFRKKEMHINMYGKLCFYGLTNEEMRERRKDIAHELGDVLWQLSGICSVMSYDLGEIAKMNIDKLASRKERGVIDGNGDNR